LAIYAIGDVQGCLGSLLQLLDNLGPSDSDSIWFTGDLVNRGPQSLETLRFVKGMGDQAISVLGNHDLHLLALAAGRFQDKPNPTLQPILLAPDRDELLDWLRHRPLFHHDSDVHWALVHAGIHPLWDLDLTLKLAAESEAFLRGNSFEDFLKNMYGNHPENWDPHLAGYDRARFCINVMTRMRFCFADGRLDFLHKGPPGSQPDDLIPWFELHRDPVSVPKIVFGHWSALGWVHHGRFHGVDTGCLWGGRLSALELDDTGSEVVSVECVRHEKHKAK
jgi:bis(5'-nucleosyl)-tetraphosphatase (symmetrical)